MKVQENAGKHKITGKAILKLLDGVSKLHVAKGKKVTHFDLKNDRPSDKALIEVMTGPTGNLRAPALRRGVQLLIGFNEAMYDEEL